MDYGHGGDIYRNPAVLDFSVNLNPLGMPPGVVQVLKDQAENWGCYPDPRCQALTEALAKVHGVSETQILCGNGAADLIFQLVQALHPRKAVLLAPTFSEYEQALKTVGSSITFLELPGEQNFQITMDQLIRQLPEACEMLFYCNPNNPTGAATPKEELEQLVQACEERNIRLMVDECFCGLMEEPRRYSVLPLVHRYKGLFVLRAFTKTYAMAGLRLGYGVCQDPELLESMKTLRQPWNVSIPAQQAGMAALKEGNYLEESRRQIVRQRQRLAAELERLGFRVFPSQANYLLFYDESEAEHGNLWERMRQQNILIRDCSNYRGLKKGYYRICVGQERDNEILLNALRQAAEN